MCDLLFIPGAQFSTMSSAYVDLTRHSISPWTASLISSLCRTYGSNSYLLHHFFDLMSSLIDYIFMKSPDHCVMVIINILSSFRISIKFMMWNTILALDELYYHRPLYWFPSNTNLFVFGVIPGDSCYPAIISSIPWSITIFYVKNVVRISSHPKNSWYR